LEIKVQKIVVWNKVKSGFFLLFELLRAEITGLDLAHCKNGISLSDRRLMR
jgi:hypothetical protein